MTSLTFSFDRILTMLLSNTAMIIAPFILVICIGLLVIKRNTLTSGQKAILISASFLVISYLLFIVWLASMFG